MGVVRLWDRYHLKENERSAEHEGDELGPFLDEDSCAYAAHATECQLV